MLIVGTDFSTPAALALDEARSLARQLGLGLRVVHVRAAWEPAMWEPDTAATAWMNVASMAHREVVVRRGTPWVELVRIARELDARFVVIGTHGRSGFQPIALGSTASRLALLAPLPVILVGHRERMKSSGSGEAPRVAKSSPTVKGEQR